MNNYIELVIKRQLSAADKLRWFLFTVSPLFIGTFFVFISPDILRPVAIVLCGVLYYLAYRIFNSFNIEWEYTLLADELTFSKIINKTRRKDILTVSIPKTQILAKVTDREQNDQIQRASKKYKFLSNTIDDYYFVCAVDKNGKNVCVFFEPDERILEVFKALARGKVK